MNWIDRAIGYVSPVAGMRRQMARAALDRRSQPQAGRSFGKARRVPFGVNTGNPDDARPKQYVSRERILRLVAENPFARKALSALLNSIVGWGITGAPGGSKALRTAFADWIKLCDFQGRRDLYGLQELWVRSMLRDGEVFIARRWRNNVEGIPLRLQTFDKGMLATWKVGANIERGIEYDGDGVPIAYHFARARKGTRWATDNTIRLPAEDVIHLFHDEFVGQSEGVSIFDSVIKRLGDVEEGIEAEVVKANISACLVGFRYRTPTDTGEDESIGMPVDNTPSDQPPVEELVPGMVETLDPGEQITFSNPPKTGGIGDLARIALLASSAGVGVTYEQMTGDLSNVNFSSYRAGALEFKRTVGRLQYLTLIPVCLDRVWGWFLQAGIDFGRFANKPVPIKWTPPPFESIDRLGDAEADIVEMQAGLESRENLLSSRGYDQDEIIEQISAGMAKQKAAGLAFKGDPYEPGQMAQPDSGERGDAALAMQLARMIRRARAG